MQKIFIPHLIFEGEKIETPLGLSELLEPAWSTNVDTSKIDEVVSLYDREVYKNERGRWMTKYTRKAGVPN
ncbi:hypothetical protein [Lysinibacillus sp. FSL W8-0992]|uniref:hypothetical protein n=1 Tax=Lysinibacillus sp. FSL W8-0992 TaxID=2954643 RepID=UPI0030F6E63C